MCRLVGGIVKVLASVFGHRISGDSTVHSGAGGDVTATTNASQLESKVVTRAQFTLYKASAVRVLECSAPCCSCAH